jgi:hypothetical protein
MRNSWFSGGEGIKPKISMRKILRWWDQNTATFVAFSCPPWMITIHQFQNVYEVMVLAKYIVCLCWLHYHQPKIGGLRMTCLQQYTLTPMPNRSASKSNQAISQLPFCWLFQASGRVESRRMHNSGRGRLDSVRRWRKSGRRLRMRLQYVEHLTKLTRRNPNYIDRQGSKKNKGE